LTIHVLEQRRVFAYQAVIRNGDTAHRRNDPYLCHVLRANQQDNRQEQYARNRHLDIFQVGVQDVCRRADTLKRIQYRNGCVRRITERHKQRSGAYRQCNGRNAGHDGRTGSRIARDGFRPANRFMAAIVLRTDNDAHTQHHYIRYRVRQNVGNLSADQFSAYPIRHADKPRNRADRSKLFQIPAGGGVSRVFDTCLYRNLRGACAGYRHKRRPRARGMDGFGVHGAIGVHAL